MKFLVAVIMVLSSTAFGSLETQQRCFIDTSLDTTATGVGALLVVASANRGCLFISNKSTSVKVYLTNVASAAAGDGIEIPVTSTFAPAIVPTNGFYIHTTGASASIGIRSGSLLK